MRITIEPGKAYGTVTAPGSKSLAHRALICAALSCEPARIRNIGTGEDVKATLECIKALGCNVQEREGSVLFSGRDNAVGLERVLNCRESGSTLRFIVPTALILCKEARITGSQRLLERGIGLYEELFSKKGISVHKTENEIKLIGTLESGEYTLPGNVSSQFISGLLMALPMLEGESVINVLPPIESRSYIDVTIQVMKAFGVEIAEKREGVFFVPGKQRYKGIEYEIEGDWSNSAFLYALNIVGGDVKVGGLSKKSAQGDRACLEMFARIGQGKSVDISQCPDLGPILMSACAVCGGGRLTGTRRLKLKESDRANAMAEELSKLGAETVVEENSVTISANGLVRPKVILSSHNDHRIVMALSVLATVIGAEIDGCEAVEKSYPEFFNALRALGISCSEK